MLIPIKNVSEQRRITLRKPPWIKVKLPVKLDHVQNTKNLIKKNGLNSVCEETLCPNLTECFNQGTATFMVLGTVCTRRCPFCNVLHGRPDKPDVEEATRLAQAIFDMALRYVVITSVDRDDLRDGGAQHFVNCIKSIRNKNSSVIVEALVPDFRGRMDQAIKIISNEPPDVFSHNLENVPRLYNKIRPGANYDLSLDLLERFKKFNPAIPTKSGLMLGLGETNDEIIKVMQDLYTHGVTMLTLGQYLQPSRNHLQVQRYVPVKEFNSLKQEAIKIGFIHVSSGPFVRSSYQAEKQINKLIKIKK